MWSFTVSCYNLTVNASTNKYIALYDKIDRKTRSYTFIRINHTCPYIAILREETIRIENEALSGEGGGG